MASRDSASTLIFVGLAVALGAIMLGGKSSRKPAGQRFTKPELMALAARAGFPDPNLAAAVAMGESNGNPDAINPGKPGQKHPEYSIGLWQINTLAHPQYDPRRLHDPEYNARCAFEVFTKAHGFTPWGAYTDGSYKKFL